MKTGADESAIRESRAVIDQVTDDTVCALLSEGNGQLQKPRRGLIVAATASVCVLIVVALAAGWVRESTLRHVAARRVAELIELGGFDEPGLYEYARVIRDYVRAGPGAAMPIGDLVRITNKYRLGKGVDAIRSDLHIAVMRRKRSTRSD